MLSNELAALAEELIDISGRIPQDTGWDRLRSAIVTAERLVGAAAEQEAARKELDAALSEQAAVVANLRQEVAVEQTARQAAEAELTALREAAQQPAVDAESAAQ